MNDSLVHSFLTDYRTYVAAFIGFVSGTLSSPQVLRHWPALSTRLPQELVSLALPFLILISTFFMNCIAFDWSGEFAGGILFAFGLVFSLRLLRFRGWLCRGVALLFGLFYGYNIYGTALAWITRAEHGHPFR